MIVISPSPTRKALERSATMMQALRVGGIPALDVGKELLADRDRLLEEIYELRKFKALALNLIECLSSGRKEVGR